MTYNGEPKALTFKKLVIFASQVSTSEELKEAYALTEISYQKEKITWADHEIMYDILGRIDGGYIDNHPEFFTRVRQ